MFVPTQFYNSSTDRLIIRLLFICVPRLHNRSRGLKLVKSCQPSFITHLTSQCLITSPGRTVITISLSSRVRITFWNPQRDSTSSMFNWIIRSLPDRLNTWKKESQLRLCIHPLCLRYQNKKCLWFNAGHKTIPFVNPYQITLIYGISQQSLYSKLIKK